MVNRNIIIGVALLVLVILGFAMFSGIAGNVISDLATDDEEIENEYFKISDIGVEEEVDLNDTQNSSGQE